MKPGPYVVWKRDRFGAVFLRLDGPFQYPTWQSNVESATPMSGPRAAWWSSLEGGLPLHIASQTIASAPARLEEPVPQTQRAVPYKDPTIDMDGTVYTSFAYDDD